MLLCFSSAVQFVASVVDLILRCPYTVALLITNCLLESIKDLGHWAVGLRG